MSAPCRATSSASRASATERAESWCNSCQALRARRRPFDDVDSSPNFDIRRLSNPRATSATVKRRIVARRKCDGSLHAAPVLAADLEQRAGDLPQRAHAHRVHQHLEHVARCRSPPAAGAASMAGASAAWRAWKSRSRVSWDCFSSSVERASSMCSGTGSPCGLRKVLTPMMRVLAGVLEHLVVHALFLDLAALVAGLHRAQHAAALGDASRTPSAPLPPPARSARR